MTEQNLQQPAPQPAPTAPRPFAGMIEKPSQLQTLGILTLISGILNCIIGVLFVFTVVWILPAAYSIVLGILEILYATKLMATPVRVDKIAKHIAIMQIVNIINGALLAVVTGILALVWTNDPKVKEYFEARNTRGV